MAQHTPVKDLIARYVAGFRQVYPPPPITRYERFVRDRHSEIFDEDLKRMTVQSEIDAFKRFVPTPVGSRTRG